MSVVEYSKNRIDRRRQLSRTLFSLICSFAICWFPIHLIEILNCFEIFDEFYSEHNQFLDAIRTISHALSYSNSCLNPFLYAFYHRENIFRWKKKEIFFWFFIFDVLNEKNKSIKMKNIHFLDEDLSCNNIETKWMNVSSIRFIFSLDFSLPQDRF